MMVAAYVVNVKIDFDTGYIVCQTSSMAARKKVRPYHHGDLRETLVKAAVESIEEGGVASFTLRECARRAGVSHAAPANHFATADELLAEVAARGFDRFVHQLAIAADGEAEQSPARRLMAMGRAYVAFARANPGVYGLMFRTSAPLPKTAHLENSASAAWNQLHETVMLVTGEDRDATRHKAAHVWALVHGIASLLIDGRLQGSDPEALAAMSVSTLPQTLKSIGSL